MATKTPPDRFEDVDWDALAARSGVLSRRDRGVAVALAAIAAVFAYDALVVPDGDALAPQVGWDVSQLDWLFALTILAITAYVVVPLATNRRMTAYYWRRFRRNRAAVASLAYLLGVFAIGVLGPLVLQKPAVAPLDAYQPPVGIAVDADIPVSCLGAVTDGQCAGTWAHPLGTTGQGKDILVLVIYGMRVSMQIGLIASLLIITIGTTVGTVAAYGGGLVDEALMRYVDIQQTFPTFLLYLLLLYLFGGSLFMFIVVFGVTSWGGIARLVRSEALQRMEEEYVQAARSAGAGTLYVIRRHLVPNVSNTVITAVTLLIPGLILFEAGLSFLQLGDPTVPSWGQVIAAGRTDLSTAWWVSTIPGFFLFFTILAFNFLGDALRDAIDPRMER